MSISPEDGLLFFGSLAVGIIMGTFGGWVVSAWYEYIKQKNKEEKKEPSAQELCKKAIVPTIALGIIIAFLLFYFLFSAALLPFSNQNTVIEKTTSQPNIVINKQFISKTHITQIIIRILHQLKISTINKIVLTNR